MKKVSDIQLTNRCDGWSSDQTFNQRKYVYTLCCELGTQLSYHTEGEQMSNNSRLIKHPIYNIHTHPNNYTLYTYSASLSLQMG